VSVQGSEKGFIHLPNLPVVEPYDPLSISLTEIHAPNGDGHLSSNDIDTTPSEILLVVALWSKHPIERRCRIERKVQVSIVIKQEKGAVPVKLQCAKKDLVPFLQVFFPFWVGTAQSKILEVGNGREEEYVRNGVARTLEQSRHRGCFWIQAFSPPVYAVGRGPESGQNRYKSGRSPG